MKMENPRSRAYKIFSIIVLVILAFLFLFPLYWIVTGAFKNAQDINSVTPIWVPSEWVSTNFEKLFARRSAPCSPSAAWRDPRCPPPSGG